MRRFNMQLSETAALMSSPDYKDRFKAEYLQLQIRIEGLSAMLEKYKAGTLTFKPSCSYKLLHGQLTAMQFYKTHLIERAKIELIDLAEPQLVTEGYIAESSITNAKIYDHAISSYHISAGSIAADKIVTGTINTEPIDDNIDLEN